MELGSLPKIEPGFHCATILAAGFFVGGGFQPLLSRLLIRGTGTQCVIRLMMTLNMIVQKEQADFLNGDKNS